jgi:hypothetical protein
MCGSDILSIEKIFSEPCLKLSPRGANQVGTGMSPDVGRLSLCQVESALASLSDGEMIALMYARRTPYDKEDLIQEAFARVLSGRRAWTKGTGAVLFLGESSAALPGNGKMVAAMMDGARGEELQAISGLGKVAYESKRTPNREIF